jgi:hypothetical protein
MKYLVVSIIGLFLIANGSTVIHAFSGPAGGDFALNNQKALFYNTAKAVGWHQPKFSTEIANILTRNIRFNNPNHKSYVYLYANNGVIKGFFPVVGKCSSPDSSATSLWHATDANGNSDTSNNQLMRTGTGDPAGAAVDSPQLDGTYGQNENGIYCYLDKPGHPMVQFNGDYVWSDTFIPLHQAPELIIGRVEKHGK